MPYTVADWPNLSGLLTEIGALLRTFHPDIYKLDHTRLSAALAPRSGFGRLTARLSGPYRSARREIQKCVLAGVNLSNEDIYQAVVKAGKQVQMWQQYCTDSAATPRAPENADKLHRQVAEMMSVLASLAEGVGRPELREHVLY